MATGKINFAFLAMALTLAIATPAVARSSVNVEADSVEYLETEGKTIFRGNVIAKRDSDIIHADEMTVLAGEQDENGDSTTKLVDARGHVNIKTKSAEINGDNCRFDVVQNNLNVSGNVTLIQGSSKVRGQKLFIDLKSNRIKMQGGRVSGSFVPN